MKRLTIALFCAFTAFTLPAQAAAVTVDLNTTVPDFADSLVNNGDTAGADAFSITFQNIQANGSTSGTVFFNGIVLGNGAFGRITSVDLIFNLDTVINTYDVGFAALSSGFQLSGANGVSGPNSLGSRGTSGFNMGTIPVFLANQTYRLRYTGPGGPADVRATLDAFQLSSPLAVVPLPTSLPLLLTGFAAIAFLRRRI